jgi:hypothetical protein
MRRLVRLGAALWACAAFAAPAEPAPGLAKLAGERLEYRVRWGALPVARAALEVAAGEEGTIVLRAEAKSRGWVDLVYPVRDRVESTVLAAELRPLRYAKSTKEGFGRRDEVEVVFDHPAGLARYVENGEPWPPLVVPEEFQDPLSCLYAYRVLAAGGAAVVELEVTDGRKVLTGSFRELRRERVTTPAGEFAAIVVEPAIEGLGGVFRKRKKNKLLIWFTDDAERRPVRIYSEVAVGSFTMELTGPRSGG